MLTLLLTVLPVTMGFDGPGTRPSVPMVARTAGPPRR
jgi:hypothetical protein